MAAMSVHRFAGKRNDVAFVDKSRLIVALTKNMLAHTADMLDLDIEVLHAGFDKASGGFIAETNRLVDRLSQIKRLLCGRAEIAVKPGEVISFIVQKRNQTQIGNQLAISCILRIRRADEFEQGFQEVLWHVNAIDVEGVFPFIDPYGCCILLHRWFPSF